MSSRQLIGNRNLQRARQRLARSSVALLTSTCCFLLLPCLLAGIAAGQTSATSTAKNGETFVLSGTVVNSVTGEPVNRALVRVNSFPPQIRSSFTDAEGHFEIDGLAAGHVHVMVQKPGYENEQDAAIHSPTWVDLGPNTGAMVLKLTPNGAIYGRVVDGSGQPVEHVPLRLSNRTVHEGRKHWEQRGMTETDEDGHFRFPNLQAGTYYLAAGPSNEGAELLAANEKPKTGFPLAYYPGVPDVASASPIQLTAGQQAEADFSLTAVPVYQLSGMVTGYLPEQGVGVQVFNPSGDEVMLSTSVNMESGIIHVDNVPAGSYVIKVFSQTPTQTLRAETRVNVTSNLESLRLVLAPAISIPVAVRLESRSSSASSSSVTSQDRPPVSVGLISTDTTAPESYATLVQQGSGHGTFMLQNVDSGTYLADVTPQSPWYVQSATYGQTNILYDDLSVATGGPSYPLEIVLRNDSASMSGSVKTSDGSAAPSTVVVVPQPASRITPKMVQAASGTFNVSGLAPGEYLVFAFDRVDGLEYGNPDTLQGYASQASHVTLSPNQNAQVSVDLIHTGKGD
jgi:hypothetical protein